MEFNIWAVLHHVNVQTAILFFTVLFACWKLLNKQNTGQRLPPGPKGLPIIGNLLSLGNHSEEIMNKWHKIYGPVCRLKFGTNDFIMLGSLDAVAEAFVKKGEVFSDRLKDSHPSFPGDSGILFLRSGSRLIEQRRFGLATLKMFGMGKNSLEPKILELASDICNELDEYSSSTEPVDITRTIYEAVSAVISHLVFNKNLPKENEEFRQWIHRIFTPASSRSLIAIAMLYPSLMAIPPFRGIAKEWKEEERMNSVIIQKQIEEHKATRDKKEPKDYIDCFLQEIEDRLKATNQAAPDNRDGGNSDEHGFNEKQLSDMVRDLFLAGSDTTSTTLCWAVLFLCKNQHCQSELHHEIDEILDQRFPTMSDGIDMNYAKAVIQETLRMRPVAPIGIPHVASQDATIMGYHIKEGSCVAANLYRILHDEELWSEPDTFNPARHIDESGKFVKSPSYIPFSIGARQCLGIQLAEMELFLFLVSMFQKFSFKLHEGDEIDMRGDNAFSLRPFPFKVIITSR